MGTVLQACLLFQNFTKEFLSVQSFECTFVSHAMSLERVSARTDAYQALYSMSWKMMLAIVLTDSVLPRSLPSGYFSDCQTTAFEKRHLWLPVLLIHIFVCLFPILVPGSHLQLAVEVWHFQFRQTPVQSVKADVYVKEYDWDVGFQNPVYSELSQQPSVTLCK